MMAVMLMLTIGVVHGYHMHLPSSDASKLKYYPISPQQTQDAAGGRALKQNNPLLRGLGRLGRAVRTGGAVVPYAKFLAECICDATHPQCVNSNDQAACVVCAGACAVQTPLSCVTLSSPYGPGQRAFECFAKLNPGQRRRLMNSLGSDVDGQCPVPEPQKLYSGECCADQGTPPTSCSQLSGLAEKGGIPQCAGPGVVSFSDGSKGLCCVYTDVDEYARVTVDNFQEYIAGGFDSQAVLSKVEDNAACKTAAAEGNRLESAGRGVTVDILLLVALTLCALFA
jgi:hypothetical protein